MTESHRFHQKPIIPPRPAAMRDECSDLEIAKALSIETAEVEKLRRLEESWNAQHSKSGGGSKLSPGDTGSLTRATSTPNLSEVDGMNDAGKMNSTFRPRPQANNRSVSPSPYVGLIQDASASTGTVVAPRLAPPIINTRTKQTGPGSHAAGAGMSRIPPPLPKSGPNVRTCGFLTPTTDHTPLMTFSPTSECNYSNLLNFELSDLDPLKGSGAVGAGSQQERGGSSVKQDLSKPMQHRGPGQPLPPRPAPEIPKRPVAPSIPHPVSHTGSTAGFTALFPAQKAATATQPNFHIQQNLTRSSWSSQTPLSHSWSGRTTTTAQPTWGTSTTGPVVGNNLKAHTGTVQVFNNNNMPAVPGKSSKKDNLYDYVGLPAPKQDDDYLVPINMRKKDDFKVPLSKALSTVSDMKSHIYSQVKSKVEATGITGDIFSGGIGTGSASSFTDGNLIAFAEISSEHSYLSLESFDPLWSDEKENMYESINDDMKTKVKSETMEIENTQNKPSNLAKSSIKEDTGIDEQEGGKGAEGGDEVLDPFSVDHLATVQITRKRKKEEVEKAVQVKPRPESDSAIETKKSPQRPPQPRSRSLSHVSILEQDISQHDVEHDEALAFCHMVARLDQLIFEKLKAGYRQDDPLSNVGFIISPAIENIPYEATTIKLVVSARLAPEPVAFTCDVQAQVQHIISHVLFTISEENMGSVSTDDYILKVHGLSEYMVNETCLGDYVYVHNCLKLDMDIKLTLMEIGKVNRTLLRTGADDRQPVYIPKPIDRSSKGITVTKEALSILMETFYKEVDRLQEQVLHTDHEKLNTKGVIQSVKAICAILSKVETMDIISAVQQLEKATQSDNSSFVSIDKTDDGYTMKDLKDHSGEKNKCEEIQFALEALVMAVKQLVTMYCTTFQTDFKVEEDEVNEERVKKCLPGYTDAVLVHVSTAHRIPAQWIGVYELYRISCGLYYGGQLLCPEISTSLKAFSKACFQDSVLWDEWLQFGEVTLCSLPRETRLCFTLVGVRTLPADEKSAMAGKQVNNALGWVAMQLFNFKSVLTVGNHLLALWPDGVAQPTGTCHSNTELPNSVLLQVNLPDFDVDIVFPEIEPAKLQEVGDFEKLHAYDQEKIQELVAKDSITQYSEEEKEYLWEQRHYLYHIPYALPKILQATRSWDNTSLSEIYGMVTRWADLTPNQALELLLPSFPDQQVRQKAVQWIAYLSSDELNDYLPQLVQALKFECYHDSALARFLIERSVTSLRFGHHLYWLLKEAGENIKFHKRYQLMFGALMSVVGDAMRKQFQHQEALVRALSSIAEKVKTVKDSYKENVLIRELEQVYSLLEEGTIHLPLNPSMEVAGVDSKSCSYFTSNTFPLKLVFRNVDPKAVSIYTMFKVGDDLRQDMLTMQLVNIMDKLWLQSGLDLKMVTFDTLATSNKKGLVELVTESETLRKIQMSFGQGLTGSFKHRPIANWLQKHNPTELEYNKAVNNFTASCAGYCVATYVLGICDRHNDNIMLKEKGHMFHIDFGKFLGDSQMFGNFKRDRVPFVLTADMAYVINGGDKPSQRFQNFVDLCSQAFNIIRKHGNFFINLVALMTSSGIPGVTLDACSYIQGALMPECTDAEATVIFTRMIEESLKSTWTQINFFIHNLAQLKFSGHSEGALLSFIPKTFSMDMDGKIKNIEIFGYQKRYNPEKFYIYIIRVDRENQKVPCFIFRRYSEFYEFHEKLCMTFPLVHLPTLPGRHSDLKSLRRIIVGRTHIRDVAEARKTELEKFLRELLSMAPEISEHDLVYTFFHPMLRDETDIDKTNLRKLKEPASAMPIQKHIQGEVKLTLQYNSKKSTFTVMVHHVRNLANLGGEAPDPYVKCYLLPDPIKVTKRKTKIAKCTFHPTYNEMLTYRYPLADIKLRMLQVTIWNYDVLKENAFLGAVYIKMSEVDLSQPITSWYHLGKLGSFPGY